MHLDPSIYLMDDENKLSTALPTIAKEKSLENDKNGREVENDSSTEYGNQGKNDSSHQEGRSGEMVSAVDGVADDLKSLDIGSCLLDNKGENFWSFLC